MTSKYISIAKEKMFPLGTHLTLLNNLFILQKKGNRIAYGNLRANMSLLGSAFTPERSGWKPNSPIYKPSELLSQPQSCPLCLGYKDTHLWVVVRIRIMCKVAIHRREVVAVMD